MTTTEPGAQTRAEKLADEIAAAIIAGDFQPGDRLDEIMLAERYTVSRTPVREALRQLVATGLIEVRPRRGAIVASATRERLETLFGAMAEIEATCARLSAMSMTPMERRRLQNIHAEMAGLATAGDRAAFADSNLKFHSLIYTGSHNEIIAGIAAGLRRQLGPFRSAQFRASGRLLRSQEEHERVVQAIIAGDAAAAHEAMFNHIGLVEDSFESLSAAAM